MKVTRILLIAAACAFTMANAGAASNDDARINQCVKDNKGDAPDAVLLKFCTCMSNKMGPAEDESPSITEWGNTHEAERDACDKEAGWK